MLHQIASRRKVGLCEVLLQSHPSAIRATSEIFLTLLCPTRETLRPHGEERCSIAGAACVNLAAMQRVSNTHVGFTRRALKEGPISGKPEIGPGREGRTVLRDATQVGRTDLGGSSGRGPSETAVAF